MDLRRQLDDLLRQALDPGRQASCAALSEPVDIVIPIYDAYDDVGRCVESVLRHSESPYVLHLINDGSTDTRMRPYLDSLARNAKSEHLARLDVIHHECNLGFIKTVNRGMSASDRHVILLNSDTIVPRGWIGRLMDPILRDPGVASVSPFSNNAWICSFPTWTEEHPMPEHLSVTEADEIMRRYGSLEPIELPTTIGFCMALNRGVLRQIGLFDEEHYGAGYCEEGDWCFRAKTAGYRNVLAPNMYVYHKLGASFDTRRDRSRDERIEENLVKWSARYPELFAGIQVFLDEDPVYPIRTVLRSAFEARNRADKANVLLIDPNLQAGSCPIDPPADDGGRHYRLERSGERLYLTDPHIDGGIVYTIPADRFGQAELESLMAMLQIRAVRRLPL